jgi:hypothetical protein
MNATPMPPEGGLSSHGFKTAALCCGFNRSMQHFVLDAEGGVYVEESRNHRRFKTAKMQNRWKRAKSLV